MLRKMRTVNHPILSDTYIRLQAFSLSRRIFCVPLRLVRYLLDLHTMLSASDYQRVLSNEVPVTLLISAGLTGDDHMLPVVFRRQSRIPIGHIEIVRVIRILPVQGRPSFRRVVERRRLLRGMVPKAISDHLPAIGGAQVEAVGSCFRS